MTRQRLAGLATAQHPASAASDQRTPRALRRDDRRQFMAYAVFLLPELIYLALVWTIADHAHLGMSLLFFAALGYLLWERPLSKALPATRTERLLGWLLIIAALSACAWLWQQGLESTEHHPLRLLPLVMLTGAVLSHEGIRGLRRRWRELLMLFFLAGPHLLSGWLGFPDVLARWSAAFAGYLLWYAGLDVVMQGTIIQLPGGAIDVTPACSGADTITYLLGIAVLALMLFPLSRRRYAPVLLAAFSIGFLTNVFRIMLLALLNSHTRQDWLDYWHTSEGAQFFGVLGMLLFGLAYAALARDEQGHALQMPVSRKGPRL